MTKTELEKYQQQLLALGRRINGDIADLSQEAFRTIGGEASGGLSNTPIHMADLGTDNFEQEMALSLLETEGRQVEEISAALERIRQGAFGHCEQCGQEISKERLQAIPFTRHCIDCARQAQQESPA